MDDPSSAIIRERTKANVLTYGEGHDNDIYPLSFTVEPKHMQLLCILRWAKWTWS